MAALGVGSVPALLLALLVCEDAEQPVELVLAEVRHLADARRGSGRRVRRRRAALSKVFRGAGMGFFVVMLLTIGLGLIGWLMLKLIDRVFGEYAILKPFEYAGGVGEDLAYLWEEWRDLRRERREREQREREYSRQQDAEIARRRRQETAEKVLSGPAAAAEERATPEDIPKADEV